MVVQSAYGIYVEILMSEKSTKELAELLKRPVSEIETMEMQLLNEWVKHDTGEYFQDMPVGPEYLEDLVCDRTDAISNRMLKIWNKTLLKQLKEK
jgi:hypothetical protein